VTSFLTAGTSLFFTNNNYDGGRANLLLATAMSPYAQEYDANGNYTIYPMYPELLYTNPLLGLLTDQVNRISNLNGNGYGELKLGGPLKGLKYRVNLAYTYVPSRQDSYTGRDANSTIGTATALNSESKTWLVENILTYTRDWDKHHIDLTGLYSAQSNDYFATAINANTFINDQLSFNLLGAGANISAGTITQVNIGNPTNTSTPNPITYNGSVRLRSNLLSQMGRINYSYDNRFLFTATVRRDGYSAFGSNTSKYGAFPSVAAGWNISNEEFMKTSKIIDALKLRVSYGKSGNQAIDPNGTATTETTARAPFNGLSTVGVLASTLGNRNLHWESTVGFNTGVDFSVLKNRISGTVEYYSTRTYDIVLKRNLPIITGYPSIYDNLGKMQNKGIELTLTTKNIADRNFRWESTVVFAANRNKLLDLYGDKKSDVGNKWFIGQPLGVLYDYKLVGIWQTGEDPTKWDPGAKPGDLKFADINGNGKISADSDRIIAGQTSPKWIGSITNTFHYKNWHLSIFIQTAQGMTKNDPDLNYVDESGRRNTPADVGYWTADNKSNTRPALSYTNTRGYLYPSDASYTRIKDITLSYTMPQRTVDKIGLGSMTFYLSGRNLHTFTHWIGWDPENDYQMRGTGDWTNNYPLIRSFVLGANVSLR
jgi:TonB-linked SusC/RagA family outer membrane protein